MHILTFPHGLSSLDKGHVWIAKILEARGCKLLHRYVESYLPWRVIHLSSRIIRFPVFFSLKRGIGAGMSATLYKLWFSELQGSSPVVHTLLYVQVNLWSPLCHPAENWGIKNQCKMLLWLLFFAVTHSLFSDLEVWCFCQHMHTHVHTHPWQANL